VPEVGVTYFAGTFVRHPLALAAARAMLTYMKEKGPELQLEIARRTAWLAAELNAHFKAVEAPLEIRHFTSVWKTFSTADVPNLDLLFYLLRERGVHIYDGFPCFMTASHSKADLQAVIDAFKGALAELQEGGFIPGRSEPRAAVRRADEPPVPGARMGRDKDGTPAWFAPDPGAPGQFVRVASV
jgi:glutamate-1-semialdehyde aminotransferase